jgi:MraZ protein
MFMGEYAHAIDDKGRLTIPAKFREELAGGAVVTRGFEKYLMIYTAQAFQRLTNRAKTFSPTDPDNRALLRFAFSGASESTLDKQGRLHIPPFLRTYASLNGECVVVGVGDYVEVWNREGWEEQLRIVNDPALNAKRFAALNLATDISDTQAEAQSGQPASAGSLP